MTEQEEQFIARMREALPARLRQIATFSDPAQASVMNPAADEIERLRADAAYAEILYRYIDRLTDPTPDDPLEKIVELMVKEVNENMVRLRKTHATE